MEGGGVPRASHTEPSWVGPCRSRVCPCSVHGISTCCMPGLVPGLHPGAGVKGRPRPLGLSRWEPRCLLKNPAQIPAPPRPAGAQPGPPPSQTGRSPAWAEWAGRLLKVRASLAAPAARLPASRVVFCRRRCHGCASLRAAGRAGPGAGRAVAPGQRGHPGAGGDPGGGAAGAGDPGAGECPGGPRSNSLL